MDSHFCPYYVSLGKCSKKPRRWWVLSAKCDLVYNTAKRCEYFDDDSSRKKAVEDLDRKMQDLRTTIDKYSFDKLDLRMWD